MSETFPATNPLAEVQQGRIDIMEKMRAERPTLREFLASRMRAAAKSRDDWKKAGEETNSAFRDGMWHGLHMVEYQLDHGGFNEEPQP